jgi:opacity protein-like surface antigen
MAYKFFEVRRNSHSIVTNVGEVISHYSQRKIIGPGQSFLKQLLMFVLVTWTPMAVYAENMQFDVNLLLTGMSAGGNDLKSGKAIAVHYNYYLKNWLAVDAGLFVSDKTRDQSREDIVGNYRASIQTQSILFGIKPRYKFSTPYEVYGRLGLLYWQTELEVEEYFAEGIPGGKDSAKDNGVGYYASIGGAYYVTKKVIVQLELRHMKQLDVFEGKSSFPFDLTINALSFGIGYRF